MIARLMLVATCLAAPLLPAADLGPKVPSKTKPTRPKPPTAKSGPEPYAATVPKPTRAEVRYGRHPRQVLDFWKAESTTPTPLAFVIHGGGWMNGSKERVDRSVDVGKLLEHGVSVVAINYRLIRRGDPEATSPPVKAPLEDAARALQFVRSQAEAWNLDKTRIGAAGGSAGACTSLWLAFHDDLADPKATDPVARESTRLACAAVTRPQTSLDPAQMRDWTPNSSYGAHAFGLANFAEFHAARERLLPWIAEYSPYALISADDPPIHMSFDSPPALGKPQKDPTHTANFGVKLAEHCRTLGVSAELVHPGAAKVRHPNPTAFLIARLTRPGAPAAP